jgi:prepilin peptidase CpaA
MRYFPDPVTGWVFLAALASVLAVASYTDERYTKVPKWLTVPALVIGLLLSSARGAWLGAHGMGTWLFAEPGVALGLIDGLLFALAGFAAGFALFFGIWVLGGCGGGDVKLVAALGAWLGPYLVFWVMLVSLVLLLGCLFVVLTLRLVSGQKLALPGTSSAGSKASKKVVIRFSLVAAAAVLLVALWAFRVDLGLAQPRPTAYTAEVSRHAS